MHDGHFGRIELDEHVIYTGRGERREEVFDRLDRHLVAGKACCELNTCEVVHRRRNLVIADVRPPEPDAEIRSRGFE